MSEREEKYQVYVGDVYEQDNFDGTKTKVYNGGTGFRVPQKELSKIKEAIALLGFEGWEIRLDDKRIEAAQIILEQEAKNKKESEENTARMLKIAEEFNALPKVLCVWDYQNGYTITLEKSQDAEYKSSWSSGRMHRGAVHLILRYADNEPKEFYPTDFITRTDSVQKKKFREHYESMNDYVREHILLDLLNIRKTRDEYRNKYRLP